MSYILDALRRAEAERERGAVPGLHDQPFNPSSSDADARAPARRGLWMIIGGVLLLLVAALAGYALRSDPPTAPVVVQSAPAARPPAAISPEPTPAPAITPAEPPPARQSSPQPPPTIAAAAPGRRPAYIDAPPPEPKPLPRKPPVADAAASGAASTPAVAGAPVAEARVFALSELPEAIRRELPKLTMGGAMYSDSPASRMVIVNGQVLHEGDKLSADLSLLKIQLKSAVFAYKGYRYEIPY